MGLIYMIRNKINNKVYIGQTKRSFNTRKLEHIASSKRANPSQYIHLAIKKYGVSSFEFKVLEDNIEDESNTLSRISRGIRYQDVISKEYPDVTFSIETKKLSTFIVDEEKEKKALAILELFVL